MAFTLSIPSFENGSAIPEKFAFATHDSDTHVRLSDNLNPHLVWSDTPVGTKSFALICHDDMVPSSGEDVNQEGKIVPADLPRVDFFHWLVADISPDVLEIPEGSVSKGVVARGKDTGKTQLGHVGQNDYTSWFSGDQDMEGIYGGYDGPCPPWNDSLVHRYTFEIFALDVAHLDLEQNFGGDDLRGAMADHILARSAWTGTYTINPDAQ